MATISSSQANYGLTATGQTSKTNTSGTASIGVGSGKHTLTAANIAYSFAVTSTGASDVATLTLADGAVAQTSGTPTLTDAGEDFEGGTLATMNTFNSALVVFTETLTGTIAVSGKFSALGEEDNQVALLSLPVGSTTLTDIVLTFDEIGQTATVTIIGQTA
jgi:hypothetical protein